LIDRDTVRARLHDRIAAGRIILGAGAGNGLSAKCLEAGGVDFIVVYNSGRYRMAGRGSLAGMMPYGDANAVVVDLGGEILPVVRDTPVVAGVCGTDPFRVIPRFVDSLAARRSESWSPRSGLAPPRRSSVSSTACYSGRCRGPTPIGSRS